ncbi:MAG: proprotein convertase P-domain-containing protein [Acidobacteriota bacterium]|nr:proprotein convertase P-domain-containing protein [Acidobacteriota bacterium]
MNMRLPVIALVLTLSVPAGYAAGVRQESPLDAYSRVRAGGRIAIAPVQTEERVADWKTYVDPRTGMPTLASGRGIQWFTDETITLDRLESKARGFLAERGWSVPMVRDDEASSQMRKDQWKLVFRLEVDGVRVENARLDFVVHNSRLVMFGSTNWKRPKVRGIPQIDPQTASRALGTYLDGRTAELVPDGDPELTLVAVEEDGLSHRLIWRLRYRDPNGPAEWVGEVDAHTARVDAFYDDAHYAGVRGGVIPEQPDGDCAAGGCELDDFPMPFADWTESGGPNGYTDSYGNFACFDSAASFDTTLVGQYVELNDNCGSLLETAGCDGSVQLGVKQGENCDIDPFGSPGNTSAARTAYYHANRVAEVARFYNPGNSWLQGRVTLNSNWNGTCNASYGGGGIYVYRQSATCANSGEIQSVVTHEWGHGYDQNDGGSWDSTSESYGDMVAMFASRQSCFATGLFLDGSPCTGYGDTCLSCTGFRDHDWAMRTANTPATPQGFVQDNCNPGGSSQSPCGGSVHCESYPIDEAMWDLAVRDLPASGIDPDSAWQLAERLWYSSRVGSGGDIYNCALPASDSCGAGTWYQQLRVADDDDADLSNGTPHAAEIYAAFARHNIACGAPGDPENQSTSSCPAFTTPVTNLTTLPGGTSVSWTPVAGAQEYIVYRGDLGCQRQQVAAAVVAAPTTSWVDSVGDPDVTRYYRVAAVGSNPVCHSPVSNCEASPIGPRLQMNAHRLIEAGVHTNGNGVMDPGETIELPVTLFNGGLVGAVNVHGRLRVVDALQGRVIEPVADWADIAVDTELESNAPYFEVTLFNDGIACGDTIDLELEMNADGASTRSTRFDFTLGEVDREFFESANETMSRFNTSPILSTMEITEDTVIGDLDVSVAITHTIPGDLIVELSSPEGTTVRLHDESPGSGGINTTYDLLTSPDGPGTMADFNGESLSGTWTLSVQNTQFGGGNGTFNNWTLHVSSAGAFGCSELICAEPTPSVAVDNLTVDRSAQELQFDWSSAGAVFGYHVLHSANANFSGDVDLTGRTNVSSLTVPGGTSRTPDLSYFQVRSVNVCHQESP